ncbi:MAG: hypothetical protein ACXVB5_19605, partial [Isosphaeraceae bacterium]
MRHPSDDRVESTPENLRASQDNARDHHSLRLVECGSAEDRHEKAEREIAPLPRGSWVAVICRKPMKDQMFERLECRVPNGTVAGFSQKRDEARDDREWFERFERSQGGTNRFPIGELCGLIEQDFDSPGFLLRLLGNPC